MRASLGELSRVVASRIPARRAAALGRCTARAVHLGHPIADVSPDETVVTKVAGTGGVVNTITCSAQLLWEVGDPHRYLGPDVIADFTDVTFEDLGADRVRVSGGLGSAPTGLLKTLVGTHDGYFSEEMILYAGPGAWDKAQMAEQIARERLSSLRFDADAIRFDYVGINAIHREATERRDDVPGEVALRIAARCRTKGEISKLARVVAPMAVSGPIATGKWGTLANRVRPVVGMNAVYISADLATESVQIFHNQRACTISAEEYS